MSTATDTDLKALAAELNQLRSDFAKLGELLQTTVKHAGNDAFRQAAAAGEQTWREARNRAEDLITKIEERPVASTAAAFGIGMLLGLLFSSRR